MKRTALKRKTPLKRGGKLRSVSKKRNNQKGDYKTMAAQFLEVRPECQVCFLEHPNWARSSEEVHHIRGREGLMLTRKEFWLAVCRPCHNLIEMNRGWAYDKGYLACRSKKVIDNL